MAEKQGLSNILFYDAPCVIYVTIPQDPKNNYREFDCGLAVANILLAAEEFGLGTVPVGFAYHFGKELIEKELGIPPTEYFFLSIALGYPHESVKRTPKVRRDCCWKYIE